MLGKPHYYEVLIRESHLDTFGHVNNAQYLQILEEARWDLITGRGYGLETILTTHLGPVILEIHLKFRRELRLREKITVETRCTAYRKKVGTLLQRMLSADGEVCAEAELVFGLFDTVARKLVAPTPDWIRAIGAEPDDRQTV
jgi:acyl-CoA thioester hydrolase